MSKKSPACAAGLGGWKTSCTWRLRWRCGGRRTNHTSVRTGRKRRSCNKLLRNGCLLHSVTQFSQFENPRKPAYLPAVRSVVRAIHPSKHGPNRKGSGATKAMGDRMDRRYMLCLSHGAVRIAPSWPGPWTGKTAPPRPTVSGERGQRALTLPSGYRKHRRLRCAPSWFDRRHPLPGACHGLQKSGVRLSFDGIRMEPQRRPSRQPRRKLAAQRISRILFVKRTAIVGPHLA